MSEAAPLPLTISVAAAIDVGLKRNLNEDTLGFGVIGGASRRPDRDHPLLRERITDPHGVLLGVYDGCGGAASGETASILAAETVHSVVGAAPLPRAPGDLRERLGRAVEEANRRVSAAAMNDRRLRGMGTTATVAVLTGDRVYLASVGDSRAYLLRDRRLEQVTRDDTLLEDARRGAIALTIEELEELPKNVITRALGLSESLPVEVSTLEPRIGDTLLLCTDGLHGMVPDRSIRDVLLRQRDVGVACRVLVDAALRAGGADNISVIVARLERLGAA